jgi:hypothetical protein
MNTISEDLKSLVATLRHALECFSQTTPAPTDAAYALVSGVDYLIRAAATHDGTTLMPLDAAYWMNVHDCTEGGAVDSKAFREGAVEMEHRVLDSLRAYYPPAWDCDGFADDGDE